MNQESGNDNSEDFFMNEQADEFVDDKQIPKTPTDSNKSKSKQKQKTYTKDLCFLIVWITDKH